MPKNTSINSVLLIGSGPVIIGQASEYDYLGSQAIEALKEEGIELIILTPNPATIMTDPRVANMVYFKPLTKSSIIEILSLHKIDAVLPAFGGQSALNLLYDCEKAGIWSEFGVRTIGMDFDAIENAGNWEKFGSKMHELNVDISKGATVNSLLEGKKAAEKIGFPLVIRPSFTAGGTGSQLVDCPENFEAALYNALHVSPIHSVRIEESLLGWKEFELELLRDSGENIITVCTFESLEPVGIHTGDSTIVASAQTLPDTLFQDLRDIAIWITDSIGSITGCCNIKFAVHPEKETVLCLGINPRASRSTSLASKVTGYPMAKIAAKLAIGYHLDELRNPALQSTSAFFEPTLDFVAVKIPRFNFDRYKTSSQKLNLEMKSTGEVIGIGRNFQEALQKACRALETDRNGLGADGKGTNNPETLLLNLKSPGPHRLFHIYDAFRLGIPFNTIYSLTKIDKWFLRQIEDLITFENLILKHSIISIPKDLIFEAKRRGYADRQLAHLLNCLESEATKRRIELGIIRVYKKIDSCAAEFDAEGAYYYSAFENENESVSGKKEKIVILGAGPSRIGQGPEFDYSTVQGILAAKECGYETVLINCNPASVPAGFQIADKAYFEPVFWEHIHDIVQHEKPVGVIIQLGGQTPLKHAEKLDRYGVKILGTSFTAMNIAEDRQSFSKLLKEYNIPYPDYGVFENAESALEIGNKLGYPIMIRPSFVLGGQGMRIVINEQELESYIIEILNDIDSNNIILTQFLEDAIEAEVDAICDAEDVYILGILENIEPAGIHSGDSHVVLPPFSLSEAIIKTMVDYTKIIALALKAVGLINIQFAIKDGLVYVVEANPRASRNIPFICKSFREPYVNYATKIILGKKRIKDFKFTPTQKGFAIKAPVFSFEKFQDTRKMLGPEMRSTGELAYFIDDLNDDVFLKIYNERNLYLSK